MDNEVKIARATSPRPWRVEDYRCNVIFSADDAGIVMTATSYDADLVVDAVNAYDRVLSKERAVADEINALRLDNNRLRQTLKKLADMYMDHTVWRLSRDEQALIDEARAALGKEPAHV